MFSSLFRKFGASAGPARQRRRNRPGERARLSLESLETRVVLTFYAPVAVPVSPVGTTPHGIASADFNHDGHRDAVIANYGAAGSVSVLPGIGNGTFGPKSDYAAGAYAWDVAVADFDGDTYADLAVANTNVSSVNILKNNGNGTFQAPVGYATGASPHSVITGDFNKDGIQDVATANSSTISVLLGTASGGMGAHVDYTIGLGSTNLLTSDFNHDGKLDLATSNTSSVGNIYILMGSGDGSFQPAVSYYAYSAPLSVDVGDFDHDGNDDLVVCNSYTANAMSVMRGYGDGTFQAPITYTIPYSAFSVEVEDYNDDGYDDVALRGNSSYEIAHGKADGSFYPAVVYSVTGGPLGFDVADDFNEDGSPDIAAPNSSTSISYMQNAHDDKTNLATAVGFQVSAPVRVTASSAIPMTVKAVDANGSAVAGFLGTVYFTSNDPLTKGQTLGYTFTAADAGVHVFSQTVTLASLGAQTITVDAPMMAATTVTVNVDPAVTKLGLAAPTSSVAGDTFSVTVSALDSLGNVGPSFLGTVHFASNDVQAGLPADYTFTSADAGVHSFNVTLKTAGSIALGAKAIGTTLGGSATVSVTPQAATTLELVGGAGSIGIARDVTIRARDAYGNQDTNYNGTVHVTSSDPAAILPPDTALVNGVATVKVTLMTIGNHSLTATDVNNPGLTGTESNLQADPAEAGSFKVSGLTTSVAGTSQTITVRVIDVLGKPATSYKGTVYFTSTDTLAGLPASYTFTAADAGEHTFSGVTFRTAGFQTVTAHDWVKATVVGSQTGEVTPAAAASLSMVAFEAATAGEAKTVTVTLRDAFGNIATGYRGTVAITSNDTRAVLPANYAFVAADAGVHQFSVKMISSSGKATLTVTDINATTMTATQLDIRVDPAAATVVALNVPSNITAGTAFTMKVVIQDAYGNTIKGYRGKVHFSNTVGSSTLPADYTFTDLDNGVHSFSLTLNTKGLQTLTVADLAVSALKSSVTVNVTDKSSGGGGGGGSGGGGGKKV